MQHLSFIQWARVAPFFVNGFTSVLRLIPGRIVSWFSVLFLAGCGGASEPGPAPQMPRGANQQMSFEHVLKRATHLNSSAIDSVLQNNGGGDLAGVYVSGVVGGHRQIARITPDGELVDSIEGLFALPRPGSTELAIVLLDGSLILQRADGSRSEIADLQPGGWPIDLSLPVFSSQLAWSPDGSELAWSLREMNFIGMPKDGVIWRFNVATGVRQEVAREVGQGISSISWLGGSTLVYATGPDTLMNAAIKVVEAGAEPRTILDDGIHAAPVVSVASDPDGRWIAYYHDDVGRPPVFYHLSLHVIDQQGRPVFSQQTPLVNNPLSKPVWDSSGRVYFVCQSGSLANTVCWVDPASLTQGVVALEQLVDIEAITLDRENQALLTLSQNPLAQRRIDRIDLDSGSYQTLYSGSLTAIWEGMTPARVSPMSWPSNDGEQLAGLLVLPPDGVAPYPLIVDVHGGPYGGADLSGSMLHSGPLEWHAWAALGYAVLVADYRGSGTRGPQHIFAGPGETYRLDRDAQDIIDGARHLVDVGIADPKRMGLFGQSHGALLAGWLAHMEHPFARIVAYEGLSDWVMHYEKRPDRSKPHLIEMFGASADDPAPMLARHSPISYADQIDVPLLVISTEQGTGDSDGKNFVAAVNKAGGEARWLYFEDEPHAVEKPQNQQRLVAEVAAWFEPLRYAERDSKKNGASADADKPVMIPPASAQAMRYYRTGNAWWIFRVVWDLAVPFAILYFGLSAWIRRWAHRVGTSLIIRCGAYLLVFLSFTYAADFVFDYFEEYVRPHSYGLSVQSFGDWFGDSLISLALAVLLGTPVMALFYYLMRKFRQRWWLYMAGVSVPLIALWIFALPIWITPLFTDYGPMQDKALEQRLLALAERAGIDGSRVYVVEKSAETKTVNAYVTGFGPTKRIVLWDTILDKLNHDQLIVVMGHEMGHYVLNHIYSRIGLMALIILVGLFLVHKTADQLLVRYGSQFGVKDIDDIASLPLILLAFTLTSVLLTPAINGWSRYQEAQADRFALELTGDNRSGAQAFALLQKENLANPWPGPIYKFWRASHPPIGERITFFNDYQPSSPIGEKARLGHE